MKNKKVYTLTISPALDYVIENNVSFNNDGLNRFEKFNLIIGGKGINASIILQNIGIKNTAIALLGGETGAMLNNKILAYGIDLINIEVPQQTRINVKYNSPQKSFELNGPAPLLDDKIKIKLLDTINKIEKDSYLLIMGNFKDGVFLDKLSALASQKGIELIFDLDSDSLIDLLKYNPFVIKPNIHELRRIFREEKINKDNCWEYMTQLQTIGAQNVIVSMGGDGAYLLDKDANKYIVDPIQIDCINPTGAGDSMLAGFLGAYLMTNSFKEAFRYANAAGAATAAQTWLATENDINVLLERSKITKIS